MERDCEGLIVIERRCNDEIPTMKPVDAPRTENKSETETEAAAHTGSADAPDFSICACPNCPNEAWCAAQNPGPAQEEEIDFSQR